MAKRRRIGRGAIWLAAVMGLAATAFAATAMNGGRIDPQGLIADDIETEALQALRRHWAVQPFRSHQIVIVDYRLPSNRPRLFIVDLETGAVEPHYVSHGRGSDPGHTQVASRFSDVPSTGMSSVGAFRGGARYRSPNHGPALRLIGLDGTNGNAYDRLIVFHTAAYFNPAAGRFGRSCGCFVVPKEDMTRVYDVIADNGFLYAGPASLNDRSVTRAQDCNSACGDCNAPLIAEAAPAPVPRKTPVPQPAAPAIAVARAEPVPSALVPPAPATKVVGTADFDPPLPLAKPAAVSASVAVAANAGLDDRLDDGLDAGLDDVGPVPIPKPAGLGEIMALSLAVPDVAPGEMPVPMPKPATLSLLSNNGRPS